jgi:hypothetical protein
MDRVISISNPGSSIVKQLNELNNKNLKFLKNQENKFKENFGKDTNHISGNTKFNYTIRMI